MDGRTVEALLPGTGPAVHETGTSSPRPPFTDRQIAGGDASAAYARTRTDGRTGQRRRAVDVAWHQIRESFITRCNNIIAVLLHAFHSRIAWSCWTTGLDSTGWTAHDMSEYNVVCATSTTLQTD